VKVEGGVRQIPEQNGLMMNVEVREVPEQLVVTEERVVNQAELQQWLPGAMSRVAKLADGLGGVAGTTEWAYLRRGDRPDEPVFIVIYEGNPNEGPVPVEVCAPLRAGADNPVDEPTRVIPAHREAYARVTKETVQSGQLGAVYERVEQWAGRNGLEIAAAPREIYWTDFMSAAPSDDVFDVAWPVE
jgi:effector-binding domain-containing protein